jgi:SAM-dependent methyltransferase
MAISVTLGGGRAWIHYTAFVLRPVGVLAVFMAAAWPTWGGAQTSPRLPDTFQVPSRHTVADAMLHLAAVGPDDVVYDLGSGDGRIVILAAQKYGARGVGIEIDPALVARAREAARDGAVTERVTFIEGDLFTANVAGATVVTLYLSTTTTRRLAPKLRQELRPGTRIVSQQFDMGPGWPPDRTVTADGATLYFWKVPPGAQPAEEP